MRGLYFAIAIILAIHFPTFAGFGPNVSILDVEGSNFVENYQDLVLERAALAFCPACRGAKKCMRCDGAGKVAGSALAGGRLTSCTKCKGSGVCPLCNNGTRQTDTSRDARYLAIDNAIKSVDNLQRVYAETGPAGSVAPDTREEAPVSTFDPVTNRCFTAAYEMMRRERNSLLPCPCCRGKKRCPDCKGTGEITPVESTSTAKVACEKCKKTGICPVCRNGTRKVNSLQDPHVIALSRAMAAFDKIRRVYQSHHVATAKKSFTGLDNSSGGANNELKKLPGGLKGPSTGDGMNRHRNGYHAPTAPKRLGQ